jgi:hypothetical protein
MLGQLWNWLSNFDLTKFLAVWGAILASITFGWSLYRDVRDRAKVQVKARVRRIGKREVDGASFSIEPGLNVSGVDDLLYVVVSVMNVGRRRMRWLGYGGRYRRPVNGKGGFTVREDADGIATGEDGGASLPQLGQVTPSDVAPQNWQYKLPYLDHIYHDLGLREYSQTGNHIGVACSITG